VCGARDAIVETIGRLVDEAEVELGGRASIGIGTPGAPSLRKDVAGLAGVMKNANSTVLIGRPLARDLAHRLGREIRIENDANCFALSEASDGAARDAPCVVGVILGTGVGSGIVIDRRVVRGRNAIAGEWGHNPLPWPGPGEQPGPRCYCGKHGCIETFLAGPSLVRDFASAGGRTTVRDVPEIVAAAGSGDATAAAALERYYDRLTRALAALINVLDPDAIVLGGGISNVAALYDEIPRRLGAYVFSDTVETAIVPPRHGDSSGVRGAAWLWPAIAKVAPHG
jgi:fructokinase